MNQELHCTKEELCERLFCYFSALCRLGFGSADIFISQDIQAGIDDPQRCWGVVLRTQGRQWAAAVGWCDTPDEIMCVNWLNYVQKVKALGDDELLQLSDKWDEHMPLWRFEGITGSLLAKGIDIPALQDVLAELN